MVAPVRPGDFSMRSGVTWWDLVGPGWTWLRRVLMLEWRLGLGAAPGAAAASSCFPGR